MHRRSFLTATVGTALAAGLAGCTSLFDSSESTDLEASEPTDLEDADPDDQLPAPTLGDGDVTVEVFSDFTCPACHQFRDDVFPTLESELIEPGEITYQHADFPIPVEAEAVPMANAARAVQDETYTDEDPAGEFFAYKTELYGIEDRDDDSLAAAAETVDVDPDVVAEALEDETYYPTVAADRERGVEAGIEGTPAVSVDGELVDDPFDTDEIRAAVEDAA